MKRTKSVQALAALAAVSAMFAVGCGGDDEAEPLSKSDFIAQADEICKKGDTELADAATEAGLDQNSSEDEINGFITDEVLPNIQQQADDIDALGAPEGDEDDVQAIVDALNEAIAATEDDQNSDAFTDVNKLAQDYGLTACGQG